MKRVFIFYTGDRIIQPQAGYCSVMRVPNEDDWVKHTKAQYVSRPVDASVFGSGALERGTNQRFQNRTRHFLTIGVANNFHVQHSHKATFYCPK